MKRAFSHCLSTRWVEEIEDLKILGTYKWNEFNTIKGRGYRSRKGLECWVHLKEDRENGWTTACTQGIASESSKIDRFVNQPYLIPEKGDYKKINMLCFEVKKLKTYNSRHS